MHILVGAILTRGSDQHAEDKHVCDRGNYFAHIERFLCIYTAWEYVTRLQYIVMCKLFALWREVGIGPQWPQGSNFGLDVSCGRLSP